MQVEQNMHVHKVGGPDTFAHKQLAELAFEVLHKPVKILGVGRTLGHSSAHWRSNPVLFDRFWEGHGG